MMLTILQQTPIWVWAILVVLIGLGLLQSVERTASLRRVVMLPLAMTALSLHGTFNTFAPATWSWVMWVGTALVSATWFAAGDLPAGTRFDPARRVFQLSGSWQPMALMRVGGLDVQRSNQVARSGRRCIRRSGIKEEPEGRGTAAEPNAPPT